MDTFGNTHFSAELRKIPGREEPPRGLKFDKREAKMT
jgi:hypothetical protein